MTLVKASDKIPETKIKDLQRILVSTLKDNRELFEDISPPEVLK